MMINYLWVKKKNLPEVTSLEADELADVSPSGLCGSAGLIGVGGVREVVGLWISNIISKFSMVSLKKD